MYQLILLIHVFAAVCIVALVLVQQGKGATMGAAFGSGASQTVFGARGSGSFLFRITIGLAAVFFISSISLNYIAMHMYKQQKEMTFPIVPIQKSPAQNSADASIISGAGSACNTWSNTDQIVIKSGDGCSLDVKTQEDYADVVELVDTLL